jgi:hypothetical protein
MISEHRFWVLERIHTFTHQSNLRYQQTLTFRMLVNHKIFGSLDVLSKILYLIRLELQIITAFVASGTTVETVASKLCPWLRSLFLHDAINSR